MANTDVQIAQLWIVGQLIMKKVMVLCLSLQTHVNQKSHQAHTLSILAVSDKVEKLQIAKLATFNKQFCEKKKDFYGFIPLSPLPTHVVNKSVPTKLEYLEIHQKLVKDLLSVCNHIGTGKSHSLSNLVFLWI